MKISNRTFLNEEIRLDFATFENCRFEGCTLIYGGYGLVSMNGCSFDNVKWVFADAARNTLEFIEAIYRGAGPVGQELVEKVIENIKREAPPAHSQKER